VAAGQDRRPLPILAELDVLDVHPEPEEDVLRIELDASRAHMLGWPR
jgi:hypothetical protein